MNIRLEENASLGNVAEELSTLMTVMQTLRTGTFTYIPGQFKTAIKTVEAFFRCNPFYLYNSNDCLHYICNTHLK